MGCDIHIYVEKKENNEWLPIKGEWKYKELYESIRQKAIQQGNEEQKRYIEKELEENKDGCYEGWIYSGRNYELFALLADVRNYYGIEAIDEPRGIPFDCSDKVREEYEECDDWHSASYFTLAELQNINLNQKVMYEGYVDKKEYEHYLKTGHPNSWCQMTSAPKITNDEMEAWIKGDVKCDRFSSTLLRWAEFITNTGIDKIIKKLEDINTDPNDIRIVFWFDN